MSRSRTIRNSITILTILALLIMILPMTVMARGKPEKATPGQRPARSITVQKAEKQKIEKLKREKLAAAGLQEAVPQTGTEAAEAETEDAEGLEPVNTLSGKNARARFVAARNAWAKANALPPGHANILFKYLVASSELDPSTITRDPATITAAIDSIKACFETMAADPQYVVEGRLSIKALMGVIKSFRLVAEETGADLDEQPDTGDTEDEAEAPADEAEADESDDETESPENDFEDSGDETEGTAGDEVETDVDETVVPET